MGSSSSEGLALAGIKRIEIARKAKARGRHEIEPGRRRAPAGERGWPEHERLPRENAASGDP